MSTEKKVIFLFLLLILLIISCVYFHAEKIAQQKGIMTESTDNKLVEKVIDLQNQVKDSLDMFNTKEESTDTIDKKDPSVKKIVASELEEKSKENPSLELKEKVEDQIKQPEVSNVEKETKEPKVIIDEPLEEKVKKEDIKPKALISIDKEKYKRVGDQKFIQDMSVKTQELQIEINTIVEENPIIFKRASTNLISKSTKTVDKIARILKKYKNIKIEIAGHTDAAGADELNKKVSVNRAVKIKQLIASYGIPTSRLIARGYGEEIPIAKNDKNGYSLINRRVEFNIIEE